MAKIKRTEFKTFLLTDDDPSDVWSLIGDGVTSAKVNMNPKTTEEQYISQDNASISVESYAPTMPIEATAKNGDAVFEFIDNLRRTRAVLEDAEAYVLNVYLYETPTDTDKYPAEKQQVSIQVDDFGGDGGKATMINYTINYIGDPVLGVYDVSAGTFTANP